MFLSEEEFEKAYRTSIFWTENNFQSEFRKHVAALSHISSCAKIYILKNYKSVNDWTDLDVTILDNSGKRTEYFKFVPSDRSRWGKSDSVQKMLQEMEERRRLRNNPVNTLTDVVLDPSDGDFSLKINGKDHLWIDDTSVIEIANYIENFIKESNEKVHNQD